MAHNLFVWGREPRGLRPWGRCILILTALTVLPAFGQAEPAEVLEGKVAAYLAAVEDSVAAAALEDLLAAGPSLDAVQAAVTKVPPLPGVAFRLQVPFGGRAIQVEVQVPEGHGVQSVALPVVVHLLLGRIPDRIRPEGVINAWVVGFDPKVRSEEARDAFLKVAHTVAWRANGDPQRLWLSGFSWGGHAAFDIALQRPGCLRGINIMAGSLRRVDFRLQSNLQDVGILISCGAHDERELMWNLREFHRRSALQEIDCTLGFDESVPGRLIPAPKLVPRVAPFILQRPGSSPPREGRMVADGQGVRSRFLAIDKVRASSVKVPRRIPVPAHLGPDAKRRKTIDATVARTASLDYALEAGSGDKVLTLKGSGVLGVTMQLRTSWFEVGETVTVRVGTRTIKKRRVAYDLRHLLRQVRADGIRHDLSLGSVRCTLR